MIRVAQQETTQGFWDRVYEMLTINPYLGTLLLLVLIATLVSLAYMFSNNSLNVAIITLLVCLLFVGLVFYSVLPVLSIISIFVGFILSMAFVFGAITKG